MLTIFVKCSRVLNMPWFWIYWDSKYVWVLNISGSSWICLWFWISQGSEYTKVLNMSLVLKLPGFWIYQGYKGSWICLIVFDWICLDLSKYVKICANILNLPEWLLFYISPLQFFVYLNTSLLISTFTQN